MQTVDELFEEGMKYMNEGNFRMAELHFKKAKEIVQGEEK